MFRTNRPTIGVTGPDLGGRAAWLFTAFNIFMAGGWPVRIRPSRPRTVEKLHGIIIGGGADVDPDAYEKEDFISYYLNQTIHNKRKPWWKRIGSFFWRLSYPIIYYIRRLYTRPGHHLDKGRDHLEFNLLDQAVKKKIPILGICRGAQLINVFFKGDLYTEINPLYKEHVNKQSIFPVKKVILSPESKLASILGMTELWVNALHHQAVRTPGQGIMIVGKEITGIVQAIESTQHDFIIGVQWHPEYLLEKKVQRRIFRALIAQACGVKKSFGL